MRRIHFPIGALGLIACLSLATCDQSGSTSFNDLFSGTSNNDSVGDVTPDGGGLTTPRPVFPFIDTVRARVRNESSARADVTMRFIRGENVIHLAFVRVLPDTITTVASPEVAEVVELSGLDDRGRALTGARFVFGVDFDETSPAEYTVVDDEAVEPAPAEDTAVDDEVVRPAPEPPVDPPSDRPVLPRLTMVEPASDLSVSLGSTLRTRWVDTDGSLGAVVTIFLQPVAALDASHLVQMGPGVGAALDGINDELEVVVQGLDPGAYRVVGQVELRVDGGSLTETAIAPGVVRVVLDPRNTAPTLEIHSPEATVELRNGDSLSVAWDDFDPDDNATITFTLVSNGRADAAVESFAIGPPIAENPDGARSDSATLMVRDVLPGSYDLLGTIDDGELVGTDRVERAVRIFPAVDNDPPQLVLIEPASDVDVEIGRSLLVRWTDSDANDDARISLLLDPDLGNVPLDGDEVLLAASLGENEDGAGDQIRLGIPPEVAAGEYRLVGAITDGLTQTLTRAPGLVRIRQTSPTPDNEGDPDIIIDVLIPPPPSLPPPTPWTVTPLGPIEALVVQTGEVVTVIFNSAFDPTRNAGRVYLNNRRYGGEVRQIVEQAELDQGDVHSLLVPIQTDTIPNDAWPRSFDIEVETVIDGVVQVHVGPRPVWFLQEAHVLNAALIGHSCIPSGAAISGSPEVSVEITWYGGGLLEEEFNPFVQFWLTKDGSVPESGADDLTHRLIGQAPGSPNLVRTTRFDAVFPVLSVNIAGEVGTIELADSIAGTSLESGEYRLVTVFDPDGINRTVSDPSAVSVAVCNPTRSPNTDKLP